MNVTTGKIKGVKNKNLFRTFLDKEIGTEYEDDNGYFTIYDIETREEFKKIQTYEKKLGEKNEKV